MTSLPTPLDPVLQILADYVQKSPLTSHAFWELILVLSCVNATLHMMRLTQESGRWLFAAGFLSIGAAAVLGVLHFMPDLLPATPRALPVVVILHAHITVVATTIGTASLAMGGLHLLRIQRQLLQWLLLSASVALLVYSTVMWAPQLQTATSLEDLARHAVHPSADMFKTAMMGVLVGLCFARIRYAPLGCFTMLTGVGVIGLGVLLMHTYTFPGLFVKWIDVYHAFLSLGLGILTQGIVWTDKAFEGEKRKKDE